MSLAIGYSLRPTIFKLFSIFLDWTPHPLH
jgi:hypothetical protein